ncbi:MAG TPA: hypothetical protein DHW82_02600 [Spirochaetia bacterium]|nr:MAG: hypothetical protein A2Y41_10470 [Spirochaetes bacterium GWB1_36_13]HCL55881.1 hypothetical protein [Spirochaetia bacterium]
MLEKFIELRTHHKNLFSSLRSDYLKNYLAMPRDSFYEENKLNLEYSFAKIDKNEKEKLQIEISYETYQKESNKKWAVFINGFSGSTALWMYQKGEFIRKGYNILCYDQIGQGKSSKPKGFIYDMEFHVYTLKSVIDQIGIKDFYLIGISAGGMIAQEFAKSHQDIIKALILINTGYKITGKIKILFDFYEHFLSFPSVPDEEKLQLYFNSLVALIFSDNFIQNFPQMLEELKKSNQLKNTISALTGTIKGLKNFDSERYLSDISIPCFIIGSSHDVLFPTHHSFIMNKLLPNSQRYIFKGVNASHSVIFELFETFNEVLLSELMRINGFIPSKNPVLIYNTLVQENQDIENDYKPHIGI